MPAYTGTGLPGCVPPALRDLSPTGPPALAVLSSTSAAHGAAGLQDLAEAIKNTLVNQHGDAMCAPSKAPEIIQSLGKVLSPLLQTVLQPGDSSPHGPEALRQALGPMMDAALQRHDTSWMQPSRLCDLDACSLLLVCLSTHLHKCFRTPAMGQLLGSLQASGVDS